jgi:WD40 repeat protein/tetratricopeptide (TPR) repeat protein
MNDPHRLDEIAAYNDRSLNTLVRSLTKSQGRFSLILVRCNYGGLRSQIVQLLPVRCSLNVQVLTLKSSAESLYTTILDEFSAQPPDAVMVLELELVGALDELLAATNKVRDSFSNFAFPVVLWVTDGVLKRLIRVAPDFKSWASPPIEFSLPKHELMALLQENAEQAFADEPTFSLEGDELKAVQQDLQSQGEELEPDIQASLAFILGLIHAKNQQFDEAIHQYQQSLEYWQETHQVERCCIVLFHIALVYYLKGKEYWEETKEYLQQCLDRSEQVNRRGLLAKQINKWGELLRQLEAWEELQKLANKALVLNQHQSEPRQVAQVYSFLAEVALQNSQWQDANQQAQQALGILEKIPDVESQILGLCYFILAKSQRQLGEIKKAIQNFENAVQVGANNALPLHQYDPKLYVDILVELRTLKFEQGNYLDAFHLKLEQRKIESQYGLRAFIGAGRLEPPRQAINLVAEGVEVRHEISIEEIVAASGRQKDVEELIERVKRRDRKLTVIYGPSGVGKSSIVQAALVPALQQTYFEGRDFLPILVQVYKDWVRVLGERLGKALGLDSESFSGDSEVRSEINSLVGENSDAKPQFNLPSILEQLRQNEHRHLLTVLIFDQFEEFFFANRDPANRREFYEFLCQCMEIPYLKLILSLREDYIYYLLELSRTTELTNIDKNYEQILYYLGNFSPVYAKAVIQRLTARSTFSLESDLVEQIVKDLARELGEVRPIELQIVGTQLQTERITTLKQYQELGPKYKLVERFLEEVVKDCGSENERTAQLVLYLLTDENNTRPLKTKAELAEAVAVEADKLELVLDILVKSGSVFVLPEVLADRYQLVHDYLVAFIRQQQDVELLAKLEKTQAHLNRVLKQQLKAAIAAGAVMTVLAASAVGFWLRAEFQKQRAEVGEVTALSASTQALLASNQEFDALREGLRASRKLRQAVSAKADTQIQVVATLQQAVYGVQELNRLERHKDKVYSVSFSPDGQFIASASADKTVKLWRTDGTLLKPLMEHNDEVWSVSFSPDGQFIASASADKTVKLWRIDGTLLKTLTGHKDKVYGVSFSPDGQLIASASADKTIKLWRADGILLHTFTGHRDEVDSVSFSPDGQLIASTSADKTVKLWRTDGSLLQTLRGHTDRVYRVSFSPDGQLIASASGDKTIKLWRTNGSLFKTLEGHIAPVHSVSFSPDSQYIASASADSTVKLWRRDGTLVQDFQGHRGSVWAVSFSPDSQTIASASEDTSVKLWRRDGGITVPKLQGHKGVVWAVRLSPDDQVIASASDDKTVKLWRRDGTLRQVLRGHRDVVLDVDFTPNGQMLASASRDNTIKLWHLDGRLVKTLIGHRDRVYSISFSPDSQTLASASGDHTIKLWYLDGREIRTLSGHNAPVNWVSYSPDGKMIASASDDKTVKLWSGDGILLKNLAGHIDEVYYVTFSPDGKTIASASADNTIKLWGRDGTLLKTLKGHQRAVSSLSFSPDGQLIASASWDGSIKFWSHDGKELSTLKGHKGEVTYVSFSKDGKLLISASRDQTVILWNLDLHNLLVRACYWLHDYLKTNQNFKQEDSLLCNEIIN